MPEPTADLHTIVHREAQPLFGSYRVLCERHPMGLASLTKALILPRVDRIRQAWPWRVCAKTIWAAKTPIDPQPV